MLWSNDLLVTEITTECALDQNTINLFMNFINCFALKKTHKTTKDKKKTFAMKYIHDRHKMKR